MARRSVIQLVVAATLLCVRSVGAQYASPATLHHAAAAPAPTQAVIPLSAVTVDRSRLRGVARGALIGTGVGAAVGIVVVAATPHSDHSEDAVGPIIGAFFGLFIGAAIGAAHPR